VTPPGERIRQVKIKFSIGESTKRGDLQEHNSSSLGEVQHNFTQRILSHNKEIKGGAPRLLIERGAVETAAFSSER